MTHQQLNRLTTLACRAGRTKSLFQQGYGTEAAYLKARDIHAAYAKGCIQGNIEKENS